MGVEKANVEKVCIKDKEDNKESCGTQHRGSSQECAMHPRHLCLVAKEDQVFI